MSLPIFNATKKSFFESKVDRFYGYSNISITGKQLNSGFDLKLFCYLLGTAQARDTNQISVPFYEVREWGLATDSKGKKHIAKSLEKMSGVKIALTDFSSQAINFKLLTSAEIVKGYLSVIFDPLLLKFLESEKFVNNLKLSHLAELTSLSARALFIHLQSNQGFPKFKQEHLAIRLGVSEQPVKNQNRAIEIGLAELIKKGFIEEWSKEIIGGKIRSYRIKQSRLSSRVSGDTTPTSVTFKNNADYEGLKELLAQFDFSFDELDEPLQESTKKPVYQDEWVDQDRSVFNSF